MCLLVYIWRSNFETLTARPYFGLICLHYDALIEILAPHKAEFNVAYLHLAVFLCLRTGTLRIQQQELLRCL